MDIQEPAGGQDVGLVKHERQKVLASSDITSTAAATVRYSRHMIEVVRTDVFDAWLRKLKDIEKAHRLAEEWRADEDSDDPQE